jgi:CHAD domain-containing protein
VGAPVEKGMGFEFKKTESVRKAIKRLGRRQVEKALCALEHCEKLEGVHEVRKDIKQLRAFLRLMCTGLSRTDYRRCSKTLKEAADHLAAARDAQVKLNALVDLTGRFKQELAPRAFHEIKGVLATACRTQRSELSHRRARKSVARLLKKLSRRFGSMKIKGSGWSVISQGVKRSYRDGRRGYCLASEAGSPEHFHGWRKRVKDLYYQTGLLSPIWPEQMSAAQTELQRLGEFLGDDHDLFLLTEPGMVKPFRKRAEEEAIALKALIEQRQKELRARALALGARFYEEKPSVFCKRLGQYWKRWRHEPKRVVRGF